jgi:hypothetical protein
MNVITFNPSYITQETLDRFPAHWELMLNGDKLLIGEGRQYCFTRLWPEKKCWKCGTHVNVQEFIFPDTPFDNQFLELFNRNKHEIYSEFFKDGVFNIKNEDLKRMDFKKIACYDKYQFGVLWYFAKQEQGIIIKNCEC